MESILKINDTIGLISCSNSLNNDMNVKINNLINILKTMGINVVCSKALYRDNNYISYPAETKAKELMNFYNDDNIKAIFDLSGGDLANEVLDYLNYDVISNANKPFFGYSDLTVILNSLFNQTNTINYNYQLRNLIREDSINQIANFKKSILEGKNDLFKFNYEWIQGSSMEGIVVGGNIRCFLKLAGTKYMPNFNNKVLFLEALGGDFSKLSTFFTQYKQINAFDNINGILLGTFSELEKDISSPKVQDILISKLKLTSIPIAKTNELGHGANSKCIAIGKHIFLN